MGLPSFFRFKEIPCDCESGELSHEILDGHGIYLFRACSKCQAEKLSKYRPDIMSDYDCDEPIDNDI